MWPKLIQTKTRSKRNADICTIRAASCDRRYGLYVAVLRTPYCTVEVECTVCYGCNAWGIFAVYGLGTYAVYGEHGSRRVKVNDGCMTELRGLELNVVGTLNSIELKNSATRPRHAPRASYPCSPCCSGSMKCYRCVSTQWLPGNSWIDETCVVELFESWWTREHGTLARGLL